MTPTPPIHIPVAPGDLVDKITIMQIKAERVEDPALRQRVREELCGLEKIRDEAIAPSPEIDALSRELKEINETLWDIENDIRLCERRQDFGAAFVTLARAVYRNNDRRCAVAMKINALLGASSAEEKSYPAY